MKGWQNQYDFGLRIYDPRIGRFLSTDPIYKEYESPYAAFSNNPIWFIDPDGADTSKSLSNSQLVDAIKVGYEIVKKHLDKKDFNIGNIYTSEVFDASMAYFEKNQATMNVGAFNEFYQQALDYQRGFKEVAASVNGEKDFASVGERIIYNQSVNTKAKIIETQRLINEKNGEFGRTAAAGAQAFVIVMGAAAVPGPAGKGLSGPRINSNTQQAIVDRMILSRPERLAMFKESLLKAPSAKNPKEAMQLINNTLHRIEARHASSTDRMYGILDDKYVTYHNNGSVTALTRGHRIEIQPSGSFSIIERKTGNVFLTK